MTDIMKYLTEILIGAILVGALVPLALTTLINITTGNNNGSFLPAGLADYNIFFSLIIPLLIIFGVVMFFKNKMQK